MVSCLTVADAELEVAEDVEVFDECLFRGAPCECSGEECRPLVGVGKLRAAVGTEAGCHDILVGESVVDASEERGETLLSLVA